MNFSLSAKMKKDQKSIAEPFTVKQAGRRPIQRKFQLSSQQGKELASAAQVVAVPFVPAKDSDGQRKQKVDHPQPREQDIEKSQGKIENRPDPEIVIPVFLRSHALTSRAVSVIAFAGHTFPHRPQPTQASGTLSA